MNKQPALPADPAAISGETPISTDDAVARNRNGNPVRTVGRTNSTDRFRPPQPMRQRPITQRRSGTDHFDMLRHATGDKLAYDGQNTRAIQHYLDHRNIEHTTRYTELAADRFRAFWSD